MSTKKETKLNLYQKLLEIQKSIVGLGEDAKSFGYKYVSGTKVLSHVKPLMNKYGILLKQEVIDIENERQDYKARSGEKSEILTKAKMRFTWIDVETGEKDENLFAANGQNDWEKGLGSALTYAERYFLLKFFHISTDKDDIDNPDRKESQDNSVSKPAYNKPEQKKESPKKTSDKTAVHNLDALVKLLQQGNKNAEAQLINSRFITKEQKDLLKNVLDKKVLDQVEVR